jgi:hypothetical protein
MGGAKAVANPYKGDLDDLSNLEGHAEVQGKVCSDVQVSSQVNVQVDTHVDAQVDVQVDAQVDVNVDTLFNPGVDDGYIDDHIGIPDNTQVDNLAQTLIGQEKDEAEDIVTFILKWITLANYSPEVLACLGHKSG